MENLLAFSYFQFDLFDLFDLLDLLDLLDRLATWPRQSEPLLQTSQQC